MDLTTCPRSFSSAVLFAFSLVVFGCDESQDDAAGATFCESSSDGSAVACGRRATFCESSSDGSAVACGKRATFCESSRDGSAVACGERATFCASSSDGSDVACGRRATYCESSSDGSVVACGGKATSVEPGAEWPAKSRRRGVGWGQHHARTVLLECGYRIR